MTPLSQLVSWRKWLVRHQEGYMKEGKAGPFSQWGLAAIDY